MRLTASDLTAVRGGRMVFAGVSFALGAGQALAVTGANGSGKSTLLRLVAGLLKPAAGNITIDPAREDSALHYLGHLDGLKTALTVRQNLQFWRTLWNGGAVETAFARFGLEALADLHVGALSAGQKRRVTLARLLIAPRPLWLLDEPATALDTAAEAMLGTVVAEHLASGGMAIVATHRPLPFPAAMLALGAA
ncbi:MAG TPA: heme ABC exporter ATP-binding protein CcmA [Bauldia sp.]|nr:heme ABC exporter ATP-binding protein CcmA [Bauldia sp.]